MGKSPGKWIKTILFGKKASRSNSSKGRYASRATNEKETWVAAKEPTADFPVDHPSVSEPTPSTGDRNGGTPVLEEGIISNFPCDEAVLLPRNQDADKQGTTGSSAPDDPEISRLEQAATKAQAAFRGYLARRAFRALRGIIRLQALVRGHLVRRQAVATLRCLQGIVKFQALVRGQRVRSSGAGLEVQKMCSLRKPLDGKHLVSVEVHKFNREEKLSANPFVSKLLRSLPVAMPLRLQYGIEEPDSAWNWLERWTFSRFWEPLPQPKKVVDSKSQTGQARFQSAETEPVRSKRTFRRVPPAHVDNGSMHSTSETEKPKRNLRKASNHPVDQVQEHAQNELEKVKRNLRKVSSSTVEYPDRQEVETEKPKRSLKKASSSSATDSLDQGICESAEKMKKDITVAVSKEPDVETSLKSVAVSKEPDVETNMKSLAVSKEPDVETNLKSVAADKSADVSHNDQPPLETPPLEDVGKDKNTAVTNGELISKEDQTSHENQKNIRKRASFPAKQENPENGLQNSPILPSYMAATESAKAKLRTQGSPRFGQDGTEKNGFTRRHSLPSSINGKLSSLSPRAQRLVQPSGKGVKNDKSLLSSRDGSGSVHPENHLDTFRMGRQLIDK